jgi:hypothetical protein
MRRCPVGPVIVVLVRLATMAPVGRHRGARAALTTPVRHGTHVGISASTSHHGDTSAAKAETTATAARTTANVLEGRRPAHRSAVPTLRHVREDPQQNR